MTPQVTVCTIVLSYNRPRMLVEALRSVQGADHVILLDDGSDFDVWKVASEELERFPWKELRVAPKLSVSDRLLTPRLGMAINMAIRSTFCNIITYLCDDDIFGPHWISMVKKFFTACPMEQVVRANWGTFKDGEIHGKELCKLHPSVEMTTGNFAHTRLCSEKEGITWDEKTIGSHDGSFVPKIIKRYQLAKIVKLNLMAGWRREHAYNMLKFVDGAGYAKSAKEILERKVLE